MNSPEKKRKNKEFAFSLCMTISLFLFILSFSISLPIYIRPVYYAYSEISNLPKQTGYEKSEIKESYDSILDYLTIPGKEFSVGDMKYSQNGKAHFEDCKKLFSLNATTLILSAFVVTLLLFCNKSKPHLSALRRKSFLCAGILSLIFPAVIGCMALVNFDFAFTFFHKLFFPGKSNWIFNPYTDEIINILPQEFFMLCGAIMGVSIFLLSLFSVLHGKKKL